MTWVRWDDVSTPWDPLNEDGEEDTLDVRERSSRSSDTHSRLVGGIQQEEEDPDEF